MTGINQPLGQPQAVQRRILGDRREDGGDTGGDLVPLLVVGPANQHERLPSLRHVGHHQRRGDRIVVICLHLLQIGHLLLQRLEDRLGLRVDVFEEMVPQHLLLIVVSFVGFNLDDILHGLRQGRFCLGLFVGHPLSQ